MINAMDVIFDLCRLMVLVAGTIRDKESFPQPVSREREEELLKQVANGDLKAKNELIECNLRLVAHVVKKYSNLNKDMDDLISIGTIGLIKAVSTYKMNKNTRLATYAARCIENEVLMMVRSDKKKRGEISLQDPIGTDKEGNEISLIDILGTNCDEVEKIAETNLQILKLKERMSKVLTERERIIIELRYGLLDGHCRPQREIAEQLDISRSYVSRIETRAIDKLQKLFANNLFKPSRRCK